MTGWQFPRWGSAADLVGLLDVQPSNEHNDAFVGAPFPVPAGGRNVVEGGQLLGQAMMAATKAVPGQRVVSASIAFQRAAEFDAPVDLAVETIRAGRSVATLQIVMSQRGIARAAATVMLTSDWSAVMDHVHALPEVPSPDAAELLDMGVAGRELRVVDGAYDPDPMRTGPPELLVWCRFDDDPGSAPLHDALMAQSITHWTIAAAMRPHAGIGEADAHETLSTGVLATSLHLHAPVEVTGWLLYATTSPWSGRGRAAGQTTVWTQSGELVATAQLQTMVRPLGSVDAPADQRM